MPLYVYEVVREDGEPGETFELLQKMGDKPYTKHPETGEPIRRVLTTANALRTVPAAEPSFCQQQCAPAGRCMRQE